MWWIDAWWNSFRCDYDLVLGNDEMKSWANCPVNYTKRSTLRKVCFLKALRLFGFTIDCGPPSTIVIMFEVKRMKTVLNKSKQKHSCCNWHKEIGPDMCLYNRIDDLVKPMSECMHTYTECMFLFRSIDRLSSETIRIIVTHIHLRSKRIFTEKKLHYVLGLHITTAPGIYG